jgi:hypothetical protein
MMNRNELADHYDVVLRNAFSQTSKIALIKELRNEAITKLASALPKIPRQMPNHIRAIYQAKGYSLEWNLFDIEDAYQFVLTATDKRCNDNSVLTPSQERAVLLLRFCTQAIEQNNVSDFLRNAIIKNFIGLDSDIAATGEKFRAGRTPNTSGPIRKAITKLLKSHPDMKNKQLLDAIAAKPPRGWKYYDNRTGKYFEGRKAGDHMGEGRFYNICSEERKKIRQ